MDLNLKNKKVLITGSSKGIGKSIAEAFLQEGAHVCLTGRNETDLQETAEELSKKFSSDKILTLSGDLTLDEKIQEASKLIEKKWEKLDVLVCNMGSGTTVKGLEAEPAEINRIFNLNFFSALKTIQALKPLIAKALGNIVCVSSIAGCEDIGAPLSYEIAKSALNFSIKPLSRELAADRIRINAVSPGNILFPGSVWDKKLKASQETTEKYITDNVPLRRLGTPDEIAHAVLFLASPLSGFTTGANFVIDGGQTKSL